MTATEGLFWGVLDTTQTKRWEVDAFYLRIEKLPLCADARPEVCTGTIQTSFTTLQLYDATLRRLSLSTISPHGRWNALPPPPSLLPNTTTHTDDVDTLTSDSSKLKYDCPPLSKFGKDLPLWTAASYFLNRGRTTDYTYLIYSSNFDGPSHGLSLLFVASPFSSFACRSFVLFSRLQSIIHDFQAHIGMTTVLVRESNF